ncbi:MAG: LysR family transcriptional regulator [Pseudomonadota bacterium]
MHKPHAHIRIDFSATCSLGPGKIRLLEAIDQSGSLSAAARSLGMSYRRGWLLLQSVNSGFQEPAVALSAGGKDGGGAQLTAFGRRLIASYRQFESAVDLIAHKTFVGIRVSSEPSPGAATRRKLPRKLPGKA